MFSEILKIKPQVDSSDLNKMERSLSQRFGNIAKKFGKGLVGALAGGGVAGLALGVIDKLLNPLKETQKAIDKALRQGNDVVTNAKQFGTTAGKLFKLQQIAKSKGLAPEELGVLLTKFQTAVSQAEADPNKQTSVRQFVGNKDSAEAFFQFIQGLQKLDKNSQLQVQTEVFGEKQILKMSEFLNTDFAKQSQFLFKNKQGNDFTPGLEKLGELNDLKEALATKRENEDILKKSKIINENMVQDQNRAEQLALDKENARIQSYQSLATIDQGVSKILGIVEQGILKLADIVDKMTGLTEVVRKFSGARLIRGIFGGKDD